MYGQDRRGRLRVVPCGSQVRLIADYRFDPAVSTNPVSTRAGTCSSSARCGCLVHDGQMRALARKQGVRWRDRRPRALGARLLVGLTRPADPADQVRNRDAQDACVVAKQGLPVGLGTARIDLFRFQNR